jgi:hypothetical protein
MYQALMTYLGHEALLEGFDATATTTSSIHELALRGIFIQQKYSSIMNNRDGRDYDKLR